MTRKCSECNFCILQDHGYSNYTVEGTLVFCSKDLNPSSPFDRWYGEDARDLFAETCDQFGNDVGPVQLDVDLESCTGYDTPLNQYGNYETKYISFDDIERTLLRT